MHRAVVAAVLLACCAASSLQSSPAFAGTAGTARATDSNIEAEVSTKSNARRAASAPTEIPKEVCTSTPVNTTAEGLHRIDKLGRMVELYDLEHNPDEGRWMREMCKTRFMLTSQRLYWVATADPLELAKQALDSAALPTPVISMAAQPKTYVNLPTWLWIDKAAWSAVSASASAAGLTVNVTAAPTQVVWDSGDPLAAPKDRTVTCDDPGAAIRADGTRESSTSDCTYRYTHTSGKQPDLAFPLTARLQWHATWTATNGATGDLGLVSRTATVPMRVGEWQVLNRTTDEGP